MLVYTNAGKRDFGKDPVEVKRRGAWEFWVLLKGNVTVTLVDGTDIKRDSPTIWAFRPQFPFGCTGNGSTERAIFDFSAVPVELEKHTEGRPYYEEPLTAEDCQRIRILARLAMQSVTSPTQLVALRQQAILDELSLIALRSIESDPIRANEQARYKVDQVLGWFASRMDEGPTLAGAARFVHISAAHLRRMFHQVRQESPKAAFTRVRKERIEHLLQDPALSLEQISEQVGLSSASTLSHFIRKHFGRNAGNIRRDIANHKNARTRL